MALQVGQRLQNRYQIIRPLGKGGMGAVYLAQDGRLGGKSVAIKQFDPSGLPPQDRQWAASAFAQEANILAKLNHPALTAVTDYFTEYASHYLVMDYVEGETLEQAWLHQPGQRFDPQQVVVWAGQLCNVLDYLHSQSPPVIFRDLKPSNIMVLPNGQLKLIDFGIARYFKAGQTRDTLALGTPGYAAPEQHGQEQVDGRADIYALGAVLHQLLTGYDPSLNPFNLPAVRSLAPYVPAHQAVAIEQALALNRTQRPASARLFYGLLQVQEKPNPPRKANPIWTIMGLVSVLILGGLGLWWYRVESNPPPVVAANTGSVAVDEASYTPTPPAITPENTIANTTLIITVTVPVTNEPTITAVSVTATAENTETAASATPMIMCTPPACSANEVYFCASDCPGGCGTTCATVTPTPQPFTASLELARSAGGRGITITQIGDGPRKIVLIGTVRGGESPNSEVLVNRLQAHFTANPDLVPSDVALYFIPTLNPDGRASGKRFNANGVDLNRNWDSPSWKADTEQPGGTVRNSGGTRPFSEPETQALRDLLLTLQNEGESVTVIAYHYHVGILGQGTVQPGYRTYSSPAPLSDSLAGRLTQQAGYSYLPSWKGAYIPSGELIQWCAIKDIAAVDVELPRDVQPDSRPSGQTVTVFQAALSGITGLFN